MGIAQGALDLALNHVRKRKVFGKTPASSELVQVKLAEMATLVEAARNLTYKAAWKIDQGIADPALTAMAKWYAGEVGVKVVDEALQLHGGYGYIDEYDISRFYRGAKIVEIYERSRMWRNWWSAVIWLRDRFHSSRRGTALPVYDPISPAGTVFCSFSFIGQGGRTKEQALTSCAFQGL